MARAAGSTGARGMKVAEVTNFAPGERISHQEFGQGVVLDAESDGYLRAFSG